MSKPNPTESDQYRFRLPPVEAKIVLGLIAALLGVCALQFESFNLLPLLLMIVFFVAGLFAQRTWSIYLMLGTFIVLKYFFTDPYLKSELHTLKFPDVYLVLILVLLAAACFRFLESSRFIQAFYPNARLGEKAEPGNKFEFPSLLGGRWWAIPLAVMLAAMLLTALPKDMEFFARVGIKQFASRLISLVLFLFFGWLICRSAVGIFIRWRMDAVQADVQCRSLIAKEMWKDVYAIEKRKVKIQSRD